jgi:carbonic anhydrase
MKTFKRIASILVVVSAVALIGLSQDIEWGYEGDTGPESWGSLDESFLLCSEGETQSPIDIETANAVPADLPAFEYEYEQTEIVVINNGHTIEMEYDTGSFMRFNERLYELLQFHFHSPSEHTIDGENFAMEMHLVHLCGRCLFNNEFGSITVLGVMIREGAHNDALDLFWNELPAEADSEVHLDRVFNALQILPIDQSSYRYRGSLTTPACGEDVQWLVLQEPIELSSSQIDKFKSALFLSCCFANNRPTQPLNDRVVDFVSAAK